MHRSPTEATPMASSSASISPLNPRVFYILLSLAEGDRHGYAILKAVESITDGIVRLTPGTLYPLIHQMILKSWIRELPADTADPRRRRYRLTIPGKRAAQTEARRLAALVDIAASFGLMPPTQRR